MISLKTFETMNTSARTEYIIFKEDAYIETVEVFYVEDEATADNSERLQKAVMRRMELEATGAKVKFVDYNKANQCMLVSVIIK